MAQLAVVMVGSKIGDENGQQTIYGAVTTGNIWQFGELDRTRKIVTQDILSYDVLQDLEDLVRIFVEILERK